jgi:release factor glutamine methyltransferase
MPTHIADVLRQAQAQGVARLDAQLLLAHHLGRPRAWLLAHDDSELTAPQAAAVAQHLAQRADGVPLAYLVGEKEFHGLLLRVTPAVLVPRPDTEVLVDWALELLAGRPADLSCDVVDLGTGSGAVALAVKHRCPVARVTATDSSATALAVARCNAAHLGLAIEFLAGDWWQPLAGQHFDLALSNPPYVAGDDPHLAALAHEPRAALTPEGDGLDALRRIISEASTHLRPGAWLLLEHGHDQAAAVLRLLVEAGLACPTTRHDLAGLPRCSGACRPR